MISLAPLLVCATLWAETGTAIVAAGQRFDVGRPVVLWDDRERGFDGYAEQCLEERAKASSPCCRGTFKRFGQRKDVKNLDDLKKAVRQLVLHHDGCVNSRSCFYSMHDMPRPDGGCGLSAHFMIDADGTIYQTLDLKERAYHAEQANPISIGIEICNRADASRNELDRLPAEYRTRPVRNVVINGRTKKAFDFRPEQYRSVIALARTISRVFPLVQASIPERGGEPLLETLADPSAFNGIVGHLHVDRDGHKWDPGAFDWKMFIAALNGFYLPQPVAGFTRFPLDDLAAINRIATAVFEAVEERSSATFPVGAGGLYHSGVNLRGSPGAPIVAPARGTVVAARMARKGASSTSFVLIRHDVTIGTQPIQYFTLLAHVAPLKAAEGSGVPWLERLVSGRDRRVWSTLKLGDVALVDSPVEAGEVVGRVGFVKRGAEMGPETRFEIFTAERLPPTMARFFREADGTTDGVWMRRGYVTDLLGDARSWTPTALADFFRSDSLDARQALRRFVVRHPHEWGDRQSARTLGAAPELSALTPEERRKVHEESLRPYAFWTDALSAHAGLPGDQVVFSYNPVAFLAVLAAAHGGKLPQWPAADMADRDVPAEPRTREALASWLSPPPEPPPDPPIFGPLVRVPFVPKKVSDIPLIDLPGIDPK